MLLGTCHVNCVSSGETAILLSKFSQFALVLDGFLDETSHELSILLQSLEQFRKKVAVSGRRDASGFYLLRGHGNASSRNSLGERTQSVLLKL